MQKAMLDGPSVWDFDFKCRRTFRSRKARAYRFVWTAPISSTHSTWSVPDQTLTSTTFGKITSQYYGNRLIQFAMYFKF